MKRGFLNPKAQVRVIDLSPVSLLFVFSLFLILFTAFLWYPSSCSFSHAVIPTFPELQEDSLVYRGEASTIPWSGWWWPFYDKSPPHLYDPGGPMDKYDRVSLARGQPNPGAMAWERKNHYTDKKEENWFGHCNGWAAAAVLEAKPRSSKEVAGIKFEINDIMGLLSEWHWWDAALAFYGSRYYGEGDNIHDIFPHEFHHLIINYIGEQGLPIIMDIRGGTIEKEDPQVWNYPAYRYQLAYRPDGEDKEKVHVHCRVWFSDFTLPSSLSQKTFTEDYYYWIKGDKRRPTSGQWETAREGGWGVSGDSRESHPDFLWYPQEAKGHPILNREQYLEIVGQGENR